ncbi:MAG: hypothetical protein K8F24_08255, partial [Bacteroidales bacterium]|nr:hypothetical protein [Bacteroidales bacterium]
MTADGNTGAGIISIDANYNVLAGCNSTVVPCPPADFITNHFEGFAYGIDASNSSSLTKTIYVRQAEFVNNGYGIRLNALNNATIIQNNFVVGFYGKSEQECKFGFGIGIELVQCNNYSVEENEFNPVSGLTATAPIGIRVLNGNNFTVVPNEIYFNHFNGMNRANQADGLNYTSNNSNYGLNYRCNHNEENYFDFIVSGGGIAGYQSSQQSPPENTFTVINGTPTDARHFFNDAENHITYFNSQSQPLHVFNVTLTPFYVNPPEPCESNYGGGNAQIGYEGLTTEQKQYFEQQRFESQNTFSSLQNLYESMADGGNTPALLTTVETALPDETWALRSELLGLSPYLSKDVLMAASDKTQVLPEDILFEVLSANPDELKDQE